jgi:hypothetical protein
MRNRLIEASDVLSEAQRQVDFLSTLCTFGGTDDGIELDAPAISGLYYVLDDIRNRIQKAGELIKEHRDSDRRIIGGGD